MRCSLGTLTSIEVSFSNLPLSKGSVVVARRGGARDQPMSLEVFDANGRSLALVESLTGDVELVWGDEKTHSIPSGVYWIRAQSEDLTHVERAVVVR